MPNTERCLACGLGPVVRWEEEALDFKAHEWEPVPIVNLHLCLNCRDGALRPRPKTIQEG